MSDIVETLRQGSLSRDDYRWIAADEITRLRAENERQAAELRSLRAALKPFVCDCEGEAICIGECMHRNARAALDGQPAPSRWVERWDAPMPYQKWCPFSADTIVEVENAYGERRAGQAASFWWGYEHEMGRTSDGVIIRARPVQSAPGEKEPRTDSRYNNAERIFGDD